MLKASTVLLLIAGSMIGPVTAAEPEKKVSPYAQANKRHIDAATGRHQPTMKRAASGRVQGGPVRRKR
jgi:hypothetical protein